MKNPKFFLTTLFAAAAMSVSAHAAGEAIHINFDNGNNSISGWNNTASSSGALSGLTDSSGANTGVSLEWSSKNLWGYDSNTDKVLKQYLDDGDSGVSIAVSGLNYLFYDLTIITATDTRDTGFSHKTVNGVNYYGVNGVGLEGTNSWGSSNDTTITNNNSFTISGLNGDLSITSTRTGGRGCIAGLIITDTYAGTVTDVELDGTAINWTNTAIGSTAWTNSTAEAGRYAAFNLSENTTVNVSEGGVVTDAIVVGGSGTLTLSGEDVALIGPGAVRTDGDAASLVIANNLIFSNGGSISGNVTAEAGVKVLGGTLTCSSGLFSSANVFVDSDATVVAREAMQGLNLSSLSGDGVLKVPLTAEYSNTISVGSAFVGTTCITSGYFTLNNAVFGNTLSLEGGVNFQLIPGLALTFSKDLVIGGNTEVHQNGGANLTFDADSSICGTGTYDRRGGGTLLLAGKIDLGVFDASSGTNSITGGDVRFGSLYVGGATLNLESGSKVTASQLRLSEQGSATMTIKKDATLTITGNNNGQTTDASLILAHWGNASTLNLNGGELLAESALMKLGWTGAGTFSAQSGEARLFGISGKAQEWGVQNYRGAVVLGTETTGDAKVYLGEGGIQDIKTQGEESASVVLGEGTLGAFADWSSSEDNNEFSLIGTVDGTVFDTQNPSNSTGHTITINNVLAGAGKLVKQGVGTLKLVAANTYSGGTTVSGGTLVARSASALGTGALTIDAGALLEVDVGGESALVFNNTVTLSEPSAEDAAILLSSGKLAFGSDFRLNLEGTGKSLSGQTVKVLEYNGGTLDDSVANVNLHDFITYNDIALSVRVTVDATNFLTDGTLSFAGGAYDLVWGGASSGTWDYVSEELWKKDSANGNAEKFVEGDNASFATDGDIAVTIAEGGVKAGVASFDAGTVTLSGGKLVASRIDINNGATLKLGAVGVIDGAVAVKSGGTFDLNGKSANFGSNGGRVTLSGGTLTNTGGNVSAGEQQLYGLDLTADSFIAGTGNFGIVYAGNAENELNLNGFTLTKSGTNTLSFSKTTLKNGTLAVTEGTVNVTVGGPAFKLGENAHLNVSGTGVANLTVTSMANGSSLTLGGTGASNVTLGSGLDVLGSIEVNGNSTLSGTDSGVRLGSTGQISISGTGVANLTITSMAKGSSLTLGGTGASSVTLSGEQKIKGNITIGSGSTVTMAENDVFSWSDSSISQKVLLDGGTLAMGGTRQSFESWVDLEFNGGTLTGSGDEYGAVDLVQAKTIKVTGNTDFEATLRIRGDATFDVSEGVTLALSGVVDPNGDESKGGAGGALVKSGKGTMLVSGNNEKYNNETRITDGRLVAASSKALGTAGVSVSSGAVLEFRNADAEGAAFDSEFSAVVDGEGRVEKSGSGTLTLSGANTFSGGLELSEGKVIATVEDALGAGDITLDAGTTLETATASLGSGKITVTGTGISLNATSALTADGLTFTFGADAESLALSNFTFTNATVDLSALTIDSDYTIFTGYRGSAGISVTGVDTSTGRLIIRSGGNVVWRVGNYLELTWTNAAGNSVWDYTSNNWDGDADFYTNENALSFASEGAEIQVNGSDFSAKSIEIEADTTFKQYNDNAYAITVEDLDVLAEKTLTLADKGTLKITGSLGADGALVVGENATLVIADTATAVSGTLSGNGRVEMASSSISVGNTFRDSADWTGTVAFVNDITANDWAISAYGNANSTIEIKNFSGYFDEGENKEIASNLKIVDTVTINNGWSDQTLTFSGDVSGNKFEFTKGNTQKFLFGGNVDLKSMSFKKGVVTFAGDSTDIDELSLTNSASATFSGMVVALGNVTTVSGTTLSVVGDGNSLVSIDKLSSSGALNVSGVTLTLSGTSNLYGTTTITNGALLDLTGNASTGVWDDGYRGDGVFVIDGATLKMSDLRWGAPGNFGANMTNDRILLKNGGILEVTAPQASDAGAQRGFSVSEGTGTYRYSGAGTSYVAANDVAQSVHLANDAVLVWDVVEAGANLTVSKVIGLGQNASAMSATSGTVEKTGLGTLTLSGANLYTGGTTISGGKLVATNAAALGTGSVTNNASLELNFDGEMSNAVSGSGILAVVVGNVELSGANTYSGGTTISGGKLVATNAAALGTGSVENNASLELNFDGEMSNAVFGSGILAVVGGNVELSGANTYSGGTRISAGKLIVTSASALGAGAVLNNAELELRFDGEFANTLSGSGKLSVAGEVTADVAKLSAFDGSVEIGGTLEISAENDGTLNSVISGSGTLRKTGTAALTLAAGTNVAKIDLAKGKLADVAIGTNGVAELEVSGANTALANVAMDGGILTVSQTGTSVDGLTLSGGTLDVSGAALVLSGTTTLSGGTIVLGGKDVASLVVAGTTTIEKSESLVFNLNSFVATDYPTVTEPNTTGEVSTVVYRVFSVNDGATLTGWTALDKGNFTIGEGTLLSDRAFLDLGVDGSLTISNEIYSLTWKGNAGTWKTGDGAAWTNNNADKASDTAYMNSDRVTFANKATVTLGSNVAPTSLTIEEGVDLTIAASSDYQITGAGTLAIGKDASLILNSGHDYSGDTTFEDGASLVLNLSSNAADQFKTNLVLAEGATGTLWADTTKVESGEVSLDNVFAGTVGAGTWVFEKHGTGTLAIASKLKDLAEEDLVKVKEGTLKLTDTAAVGTAKTTLGEKATLEIDLAAGKSGNLGFAVSGSGNIVKSGEGTLTIEKANEAFGGAVSVDSGKLVMKAENAFGDSRKATSLEIAEGATLELAFGGTMGKVFKGAGTIDFSAAEVLTLTGNSGSFAGEFKLAGEAYVIANQASSLGNGTVSLSENSVLSFNLAQKSASEFKGAFAGTGTVSVKTDSDSEMTFSGESANFDGTLKLENDSTIVATTGAAFGSAKANLFLGDTAEVRIASGELAAKLSGNGSLTKQGDDVLELSNSGNDFAGVVAIKGGTLRTSLAALGKSSLITLGSESAKLELITSSGKTETLDKALRGNGDFSVIGGGTLNWNDSEKRFSGNLSVSGKTTLNTSEHFTLGVGKEFVLSEGSAWNANGGFTVKGDSRIYVLSNGVSGFGMRSAALPNVSAGAELSVGGFVASANAGTIEFSDVSIVPTDGGNGALIAFDVDSVSDAKRARITLTADASISLDKTVVEVTLGASVGDALAVNEIALVARNGQAVGLTGVESATVFAADGTEVKYIYDSRTGSLSLNPISPEMNLAYAAMVAMPTEVFNQDVQSLHRRMEQRRFETASNKDEWQFFAQAQSMSVENGNNLADSAAFDFSTYGALVGGDVRLSESSVFGMALAYDRGTADIHNSQGEIAMDSYRATVYAGTVLGDYCFAEGGAHFGFASYEIDRRGDYGNNKGDTDGWSAGLFANAGGLIPTSVEDLYLTPYVGIAYLHSAVAEIEETGTRSMATDDFEADSLRARVGIGASYAFALGETPTRFGLDLAYSHEFLDDELDAEVRATGIAYSRTITEKVLPSDVISAGASLDFTLSENTGLYLNYTADFGMNSDIAHRANLGFRFTY